MPSVEPIAFASEVVMAITTRRSQASAPSTGAAAHCGPVSAAKPLTIDRAAEADPWRAIWLISRVLRFNPQWLLIAVINAANPDAEEASPAPVGKLLLVVISSGDTSYVSRRLLKKRLTLASVAGSPFIVRRSLSASFTCVRVASSSSVMDRDGVAGSFSSTLPLPQYFTRAMFGCARAVVTKPPRSAA